MEPLKKMDKLAAIVLAKTHRIWKLEIEIKMYEEENHQLIDNIDVKERELQSISSKEQILRGNEITEAIETQKHQVVKINEKLASLKSRVKNFQDNAEAVIDDSIDLDREIASAENAFTKKIVQILNIQDETYDPPYEWMKDPEKLLKKADQMWKEDIKFLADHVLEVRGINDRLAKLGIPRAKIFEDSFDIPDLHGMIPED